MKRLYVADLDNTLLWEGALPPGTGAAIRRIIDSGADFTISTARGRRGAIAALEGALPKLPMIVLNGCLIAHADGQLIKVERLEPDAITLASGLAREIGAACCLIATDGQDDIVFAPAPGHEFMDWTIATAIYFKAQEIVHAHRPQDAFGRAQIVRIVICGTSCDAAKLYSRISEVCGSLSLTITNSRDKPGFAWLEISAQTGTKEQALGFLCSFLGYSLDETVYYGDGENDLASMILAGESIAVANAEREVILAADGIIGEARTGAVATDLLRRLGL